MKILLIEDDAVIAERVRVGLEGAGFFVVHEADGKAGLERALHERYALVVLDLMLPGLDGVEICEALRRQRNTAPILVLTARNSVGDRVRGLDAGADDYLAKPFDFAELEARVRSLLRRDKLHRTRTIRVADLEIDTVTRDVRRHGCIVKLTRHEYELLHVLAANEGRVLSRETLLQKAWTNDDVFTSTINVHIASLRKKLDASHRTKLIHTLYGVGYVLRATAEGVSA